MANYIRCPECSFCLGMYFEFVECAKEALYQDVIFGKDSQYREYDPDNIYFNSNITPSLEHIFDAIGVKRRCCRMHLVTKTDFDKRYK